ncbi:MAG TPA: pilin [Candidatus Saccharimonadales bacterium]|nr:pilin [Candidatus Saccharimonadales bacterium]
MEITKKQIFSFIFLLFVFSPVFLSPLAQPAHADQTLTDSQIGLSDIGTVFGGQRAQVDPRFLATNIITIVLGFLAVIFLGLTVYAGFKYMTAGGNATQTEEAVKLLRNAIIGLVIILAAWMLTRYVIVILNRAVKNADTTFYPTTGM